MLTELRIENFAIIDHLELDLRHGLVTFTGETGAGKSIIIDAVESLLGGRADISLVRGGADRANVEGVFHIPPALRQTVQAILSREELQDDPEWLILGREIRLNGRNIARVNGRVTNTGLLRELGEYLIDVHGQSEHLSLLRVKEHLVLLDSYSLTDEVLASQLRPAQQEYRSVYQRLKQIQNELDHLQSSQLDATRRMEMLQFQINEIEAAHLQAGEESELRDERNRLANVEGLAAHAQQGLLALDEGTPESPSALDLLGQVVHELGQLVRLDATQKELSEQIQVIFETTSDISHSLRNYLDGLEFNPRRLDQVEERLGLISNLKRKYGDSIPAILAFAQKARTDLENISGAGEQIANLESERSALLQKLASQGEQLSRCRRKAGIKLASQIETELADLHMEGARFTVDFQSIPDLNGVTREDGSRVAYTIDGLEKIEFMIAPNPGEGFKPLVKIASGGETSRLMLALKNVLARADGIPTLIFDEIDQGIGGRVGGIVGEKLWSLARQHQVLCITHLPQLAAYGEQHFHVRKTLQKGRTSTQVELLEGTERLSELALMFGEISESTLRSAQDLILVARARTLQQ